MQSTKIVEEYKDLGTTQVIGIYTDPFGLGLTPADRMVRQVAGNRFHDQMDVVWANGKFRDGDVVIAKLLEPLKISFEAVAFVCDSLSSRLPVSQLVATMLTAVDTQGYTSLALTVPRAGMPRLYPTHQLIAEFASALSTARADHPNLDVSVLCMDMTVLPIVQTFFG